MTLSEFIYHELVNDGTLDDDVYTSSDLSRDMLLQETELGNEEIDDLISQYKEYCEDECIDPDMDME